MRETESKVRRIFIVVIGCFEICIGLGVLFNPLAVILIPFFPTGIGLIFMREWARKQTMSYFGILGVLLLLMIFSVVRQWAGKPQDMSIIYGIAVPAACLAFLSLTIVICMKEIKMEFK